MKITYCDATLDYIVHIKYFLIENEMTCNDWNCKWVSEELIYLRI